MSTEPLADPAAGLGDPYAASSRETTEGRVYTVTGGDWDEFIDESAGEERIVINFGPQHPSAHGVLRLVFELEGETIVKARSVIGYLHTGIEKNVEYRTWTQGVTFVTRMDYLAPLHNETAYCMAVEKLLGVEAPPRAQTFRVMLMELSRIASHLVFLATGAMEMGATTGMTFGFREREEVLHLLEYLTGLRMNHAFVRPGGVAQDLPEDYRQKVLDFIKVMDSRLPSYDKLFTGQPIWKQRLKDVGYLPLDGCMQLGVTGPVLRSAGLAWDLRKVQPYCGYEDYEFEVPTSTGADCYARYLLRLEEMHQSLKIIRQCLDKMEPGPVMVSDAKIAWPAKLTIGPDGMGNSLEHVRKIMGQSMESLIHHFKLVTEGFDVPPGQVYVPVESPRGELGYHVVSDGGTRPMRVHVREPSFVNLQALPAMVEGGLMADAIASLASLDPVMGGVDR
ncbi:NADH dehydrogenase subunit D [Saccharopolyspora erythraea NRRL 2338]|uniref:NADH-quinone oxidoreductase subunit D n=2 Tax=Saccharopolyspora erythraea TaxID=1836 RepID=NUOD_SACEN|nr:NADH-quinone oxidoreductase subunit D [Saccharopolyspora erythraea]A4FPT8.1 RecName: Full=NADH-quinone oxidoreductase subunit D; AltName: Full=NADH dehydrogenase I subunit D; AltName: Full=NDH-1 subunit D [Saccharopolyspora erythraea NRRL 2338]EQD86946.1 NADH dehydrogenase subunit D [Saccharopolyspora erythraea D]PFG99708.1 NADH dehydrogenase subunit D [Saccharopolyspora erythraea NRRL 2338]QRK89591.1 NADH-quinone oxidoreductase subunit D [Saccharopolyspora erythraea]CAM06063.1 NADH dehydro